jgi:hypothetical protein
METALVRGGYLDSVELDVPMNYRELFGDLQARRVSDGNLKFYLALAVGSDPQLGAHGSVHGRDPHMRQLGRRHQNLNRLPRMSKEDERRQGGHIYLGG